MMTGLRDYKPLRMIAEDPEDVGVISAVLQDAIGKVRDFAYIPSERRFAFVVNRFLWECAGDGGKGQKARVRTGCHFDDVMAARHQQLKLDSGDGVVELLAVRFEAGEDGGGAILLDFSGGGAIRLEVESINGHLMDLSAPWPTRLAPKHEV